MADADPLITGAPADHVNVVFGDVGGSVVQARDIDELHLHIRLPDELPIPRQLPPAPTPFVNRHSEVTLVDGFSAPAGLAGVAPVVILAGGHGVGKTATSRHWAHANSERFPDGQLFVDYAELRHGGAVAVGEVVGGLLRALGVRESVIPAAITDRVALFRSRVADKRILILVDDARYAAEVTPLIPASSGCCVLVTTREPMRQLVVEGANLIRVAPLDDGSAELLLGAMIGVDRVADEREAARELSALCAGLPVALRICAAQLAGSRSSLTIGQLVERLADEQRRLGRLHDGSGRSLQVIFDDAYQTLGELPASLYRAIGIQPAHSVGPELLAQLEAHLGCSADGIDALLDANLVEDSGGRLRLHELLKTHARILAARHDNPEQQEAIIASSTTYYLRRAHQMDLAIVPDRLRFAENLPDTTGFSDPAQALDWFEAERPNLLAVLRSGMDREQYDAVWKLAEAMWIAYNNHKHLDEAREVYALGVTAAAAAGLPAVEARMRQQLARAEIELGQFPQAQIELDAAARLAASSDEPKLKASILEFRGVLDIARQDYEAAIRWLEQARDGFADLDYRRGMALQDYLLGRALTGAGRAEQAIARLDRAAELVDREIDVVTYGRILLRSGEAYLAAGQLDAATVPLERAIEVMRTVGALVYVATALEVLASVHQRQGLGESERRDLAAALELLEALGSPRSEVIRARLDQLS